LAVFFSHAGMSASNEVSAIPEMAIRVFMCPSDRVKF
jgi:hypothetical protein